MHVCVCVCVCILFHVELALLLDLLLDADGVEAVDLHHHVETLLLVLDVALDLLLLGHLGVADRVHLDAEYELVEPFHLLFLLLAQLVRLLQQVLGLLARQLVDLLELLVLATLLVVLLDHTLALVKLTLHQSIHNTNQKHVEAKYFKAIRNCIGARIGVTYDEQFALVVHILLVGLHVVFALELARLEQTAVCALVDHHRLWSRLLRYPLTNKHKYVAQFDFLFC